MLLKNLITEVKNLKLNSKNLETEILYIWSDTRKLSENDIFIVYDSFGEKTKEYIELALEKNCKTILISKNNPWFSFSKKFKNVIFTNKDAMYFHGEIASVLKGNPSEKLKIIAITGTNGKTSMTYILNDIFTFEGKNTGIIGTIQTKYGNKSIQTGFTTPDPSVLHEILADMLEDKIEFVFMEASSHGLKLGRLNGLEIDVAVFTNLTRDHLDFHKTMNDYLKSKFMLFQLLEKSSKSNKFSVISSDSEGSNKMLSLIKKKKFSYPVYEFGKKKKYEGKLQKLSISETYFEFIEDNNVHELQTNLLGNFNYINVSLAIVVARNFGIDFEHLKLNIDSLNPVNGRFQIIQSAKKNRIGIVDYAHTPDALENILQSIKEIPHSKLITVFGCGGDRDKTKRPLMAKIAAKYSDRVIITSDNPRTEEPESILYDIEKGFPKNYENFLKITNRKQAIKKGIEILPDDGILLVAGKGHETVQIIGNKKENFSDANELQQAFSYDELSRR